MRAIRASEIGTFVFCRRAWWYQQRGVPADNLTALKSGLTFHERHNKAVMSSNRLRLIASILVLVSLFLIVSQLLFQIM